MIEIDNGCVSSSSEYLGQDFSASFDPNEAVLNIRGEFSYKHSAFLALQDCGQGKTHKLVLREPDLRRYAVRYQGESLGVFDLTRSHGWRQCFGPATQASKEMAELYSNRRLMTYEFRSLSFDPQATIAKPDSVELFKQFNLALQNHKPDTSFPDTDLMHSFSYELFHKPSLLGKTLGLGRRGYADKAKIFIRATSYGSFADNAMILEYVGEFLEGPAGWNLDRLWHRRMCERGEHRGQWVRESCTAN